MATAALGAGASFGFPLTHREHAQSCVFVTGHLKGGTDQVDWKGLARPGDFIDSFTSAEPGASLMVTVTLGNRQFTLTRSAGNLQVVDMTGERRRGASWRIW